MEVDDWSYHCKILGVDENASQADIKKAYIEQAKLFHPDHHKNSAVAKNKFQQLQESYNYLSKHKNPNVKTSSRKRETTSRKAKPRKNAVEYWIWVFGVAIFVLASAAGWLLAERRNQHVVIPTTAVQPQENVEDVLKEFRLYTFDVGSNQNDCKKLYRDDPDYNALVAARERLPVTTCGDIRAYVRHPGSPITVVSPSLESCRCQIKESKIKRKIDPHQSKFGNNDL